MPGPPRPKVFAPGDRAVDRGAGGDAGDGGGHVLGRHGLDEGVGQADGVAVGGLVGDAADELEELGGVHDRVRLARVLDQPFLDLLGRAANRELQLGA